MRMYLAESRFIRIIFLCPLMVLLIGAPVASSLQDEAGYTGTDVVFLVDQSGSMEDSDPNELRFSGPQFACDWMGRTLLEYDLQRTHEFRIAVISFGSDTHLSLPPTRIAPKSEDVWNTQFEQLSKQLGPESLPQPNLGETDLLKAFTHAKSTFEEIEQAVEGKRLRSIVLLTDGLPWLGEPDFDWPTHMEELVSLVEAEFPYQEYRIYVLGMNDPSFFYWPYVEEYWETITQGQAELVENSRTLGSKLQTILGDLARELGVVPESHVQCGSVPVDPYLELLRFTVHKATKDSHVTIYDPNGNLVGEGKDTHVADMGGQEVWVRGAETPIESITILDPQPGYWRLECPAGQQDPPPLFKRQVPCKTQPILPSFRPLVLLPFQIEYHVLRHGGRPALPYEDPMYQLSVHASISTDDTTTEIPLTFDAHLQGYVGEYVPTTLGEHGLSLVGSTHDPSGAPLVIDERELGTLLVEALKANLHTSMPSLVQFVPASLNLELTDSQGTPVSLPAQTLRELDSRIMIASEALSQTLKLVPQADGRFIGSFFPYKAGSYHTHLRIVNRLPSGKVVTVTDQNLKPLNVTPVPIQTRINQASPTKLVPVGVTVVFGGELLGKAQTADVSSLVQLDGVISIADRDYTVPFERQGNGTFMAEFVPRELGRHEIHVTGLARSKDVGEIHNAIDAEMTVGRFWVEPVRVRCSPETSAAPQFLETMVSIRVTDQADRPLSEVIAEGYDISVRLRMGRDSEFQMKDQGKGHYMVRFRPMGARTHPLHVTVEAREVSSGQIIPLGDETLGDLTVESVLTWPRQWLVGTLVILIGVLVAVVTVAFYLRRRHTVNPKARGYLALRSTHAERKYVDVHSLAAEQQRHFVWIPKPGSPLREIIVEQSPKDADHGYVYVTTLDRENFRQYERRKMLFGDELPLLEYFELSFGKSHPEEDTGKANQLLTQAD